MDPVLPTIEEETKRRRRRPLFPACARTSAHAGAEPYFSVGDWAYSLPVSVK